MDFFQAGPQLANQYLDDRILRSFLRRKLPPAMLSAIEHDLSSFGDDVATSLLKLSDEAEAAPPQHIPYDPWGKRVDHIQVSSAWKKLEEVSATQGIVAIGYERTWGEYSRLYQFAKLYLFHPSSAIFSCPLAMTDGAARLIEVHGSEHLKKRALKKLISRNPNEFWTSGQWMTERTGGSDVSGTSTIARWENGTYRLYGDKWFTSATTSQMAMTLAKVEGDEKLSLFYVELRDESGDLQSIRINRLKDKMGTKALPTAELTLAGTPAILVGEQGRGVKTIATLFNVTRVYNACCAVGYMRRGLALAKSYAGKRIAFGKKLIDHDLHMLTLANLQVRFEGSFLLTFHAVHLLGKEELGKASEIESGTLRLLIPLAKLFTGKEGVSIASEVVESFGGAGYVEDTGIPQLLRNAQVLSIWEGTTNVLSLDVLRAIQKENAGDAFVKDMQLRLSSIKDSRLAMIKETVTQALVDLITYLQTNKDPDDIAAGARAFAFSLARTYIAGLLLEQAQWEFDKEKESLSLISLEAWVRDGLIHLPQLPSSERMKLRSLL